MERLTVFKILRSKEKLLKWEGKHSTSVITPVRQRASRFLKSLIKNNLSDQKIKLLNSVIAKYLADKLLAFALGFGK